MEGACPAPDSQVLAAGPSRDQEICLGLSHLIFQFIFSVSDLCRDYQSSELPPVPPPLLAGRAERQGLNLSRVLSAMAFAMEPLKRSDVEGLACVARMVKYILIS